MSLFPLSRFPLFSVPFFQLRQSLIPKSRQRYSVITRSAHSMSETKIVGLPNFAPQEFKSVSVTPRAREQAPQEKIGMRLATTFAIVSLNGGQPTGMIAFAVSFRIK